MPLIFHHRIFFDIINRNSKLLHSSVIDRVLMVWIVFFPSHSTFDRKLLEHMPMLKNSFAENICETRTFLQTLVINFHRLSFLYFSPVAFCDVSMFFFRFIFARLFGYCVNLKNRLGPAWLHHNLKPPRNSLNYTRLHFCELSRKEQIKLPQVRMNNENEEMKKRDAKQIQPFMDYGFPLSCLHFSNTHTHTHISKMQIPVTVY